MRHLLLVCFAMFPSSFFVSLIACPVNKMSHLLKLAQDYQAKGVLDLCVKCLQDVQKSKQNVVKILSLANRTVTTREDGRLDSVRGECNNLIKNMELSNVKENSDFKHLDRDSLQSLYVERTGRLETFLKEVYPQFVGLAEYSLHLSLQSSLCGITRCPQHFPSPASNSKANVDLLDRLNSCPLCREMIAQLVSSSIKTCPRHTGLNAASMPSQTVTAPIPTAFTILKAPNSTRSQIDSETMSSARTNRVFDSGTTSLVSTGSVFSFATAGAIVTTRSVGTGSLFGSGTTSSVGSESLLGFRTTSSVGTTSLFVPGTTSSVGTGSLFGSGTTSSVGTGNLFGSRTTSSVCTGNLFGSGTTGPVGTGRLFGSGTTSSVGTGNFLGPGPRVQLAPEACLGPGPRVQLAPETCLHPGPRVQLAPEACLGPRPRVQSAPVACLVPGPQVQLVLGAWISSAFKGLVVSSTIMAVAITSTRN